MPRNVNEAELKDLLQKIGLADDKGDVSLLKAATMPLVMVAKMTGLWSVVDIKNVISEVGDTIEAHNIVRTAREQDDQDRIEEEREQIEEVKIELQERKKDRKAAEAAVRKAEADARRAKAREDRVLLDELKAELKQTKAQIKQAKAEARRALAEAKAKPVTSPKLPLN